MASFIHFPTSKCIIFIFLFSYVFISVTGKKYDYVKTADPKSFGLKKEKLTHFRVYWQDVLSGSNPSGVTVVQPPLSKSKTFFGMVRMIDNPLTMEPGLGSKMVGRAQGFYASASQEGFGLLMVMNFAFMEGKYNGSTISVLGRNTALSKVREMPVIGGSGLFRFARGYVEARTSMFNLTTGDATVEYNCYVLHY